MQPKTANKRDRLAARLTRGSQPGRARVAGTRFSKGRRRRPKGSPNVMTSNIKEAVIAAANAVGRDGRGTGGMQGYMERLALHHEATFAILLRAVIPTQVNVEPTPQVEMKTVEEVRQYLLKRGTIAWDHPP
jgi:hypothetical protein